MKKQSITLWVLLLLSVLLSDCFKPKEILIDRESKDYCLFDKDSYWIYQDSVTLAVDSTRSFPNDHRMWEEGGFNCEAYLFNIVSHYQDTTYRLHLCLTASYYIDSKITGALEKRGYGHFYYHSGKEKESFHPYKNSKLAFFMKKNSYSINEIKFNEIKIFEYSDPDKRERYYWARHVGLIREEKYNENDSLVSVRNLIRYNVKPYKQ
jgi:hypothetical protein